MGQPGPQSARTLTIASRRVPHLTPSPAPLPPHGGDDVVAEVGVDAAMQRKGDDSVTKTQGTAGI